jgi:hypothetical protein
VPPLEPAVTRSSAFVQSALRQRNRTFPMSGGYG